MIGHPINNSPFFRRGWARRLSAPGNIHMAIMKCQDCDMSATGVPNMVHLALMQDQTTDKLGECADNIQDMREAIIDCLGGENKESISQHITSEVLTHLSAQIVDIQQRNEDHFERRLALMEQRVLAAAQQVVGQSQEHGPLLPPPPPSPTFMHDEFPTIEDPVVDIVDEPAWDPQYDEQQEDLAIQAKYNLHPWARKGSMDKTRLHPTEKEYDFPCNIPVAMLYELWHRPDERDPALKLPPLKAFRCWDVTLNSEKNFYKAKAVVSCITEYARRAGVLPERARIGDLSLQQLQHVCEVGVRAIIDGHNTWLKKVAESSGDPFKEFKPRKILTMSYTTMAKYLHRAELQ